MSEYPTVVDVVERVNRYQRQTRCPECTATVSIRGLAGDHWWTCTACDAVGLGYPTRAAARDALAAAAE